MPTTIIHSWAAPRTLSTATLYAFAQRSDTIAYDEPLYAHYLNMNSLETRPYREELLKEQDTVGDEFLERINGLADMNSSSSKNSVLYLKHISKFRPGLSSPLLIRPGSRHMLLVRDPYSVITSWDASASVHKN